ncbi:class I SAM-dependent methyltransferase [Streptomyces sp. NPDC013178]|uniref:SAM-dependent methyltransferase n=1 Tax=unclassified Streptomyces TaxID=2593676 RepID=UPI0033C7E8D7
MDLLSLAKNVTRSTGKPVADLLTATRVLATPRTPLLLALSKGFVEPVHRAAFLSSAAGSGILRRLAEHPCDLGSLAEALRIDEQDRPRLRTWLEMGVTLGDLGRSDGRYRLRSRTAKALAQPRHDTVAAVLEEVLRFHVPVLLDGPRMLREGRRLTLADQDGTVIARSTRVVRPLVERAVARTLDTARPVRLLEVGCGSGVHVRYAARRNPRLSALAVDLQPDVACQAARNVAEWGLSDRVEVRQGDLRTLDVQPQFDLVTLHNNIYYFPHDERVSALRRARALLSPGGKLLLTTSCRGGNSGLEALNLWFEYADFGGPLPRPDELARQLTTAGFGDVRADRLLPGAPFHAFTGTRAGVPA